MKIAPKHVAVKTIVNRLNKEQISLKHKLQRREGQWSTRDQSMLIDTLLRGYLTMPVVFVIDNGMPFAIDGVQRLSTLRRFVNDDFRLSKGLEPVELNGKTYDIVGKKYSKLDEDLKDELDAAQILIYEISDYTEKDVREFFSRLNNGKPLNTTQKFTTLYSDDFSEIMQDITSLPFFEHKLTPAQLKSSTDYSIVLETLMLCEASKDYDFGSFTKKAKNDFILHYNDNINIDKINMIKDAISKLDVILPNHDEKKIPKTTLPFLCYGSYRALKDKCGYEKFATKVKTFIDTYDDNTEYKEYLSNGTSSTESVQGRFKYWRNIMHAL